MVVVAANVLAVKSNADVYIAEVDELQSMGDVPCAKHFSQNII